MPDPDFLINSFTADKDHKIVADEQLKTLLRHLSDKLRTHEDLIERLLELEDKIYWDDSDVNKFVYLINDFRGIGLPTVAAHLVNALERNVLFFHNHGLGDRPLYTSKYGRWTADGRPDNYCVRLEDEFASGYGFAAGALAGSGNLGWNFVTAVGGAQAYLVGEVSHPGIIQLTTAATVNTTCRLQLTNVAAWISSDLRYFSAIVRIPDTGNMAVRLGILLQPGTLGEASNGIYFSFLVATSANWRGITKSGGAQTTLNTGVQVIANNWYKLEFVRNLAGNGIEFYVNEVLRGTNTTNIPAEIQSINLICETTVAAAKDLDVDYVGIESIAPLGQRWT